MDAAVLLYAALLAAALLYLALVVRRRGTLPPGPTGLPLVGSLLSLDPDLHVYFARLAARYGPVFSIRLGSKLGVVVTSPALAREVLRDQDLVFSGRDVPDAARSISYGGGQNIVWNPVGPAWRLLRRVCVREMLGPAGLENVRGLRAREFRATLRLLRRRRRADVPHHHERHHGHAVGRPRGRPRGGREGLQEPGRGDHRDARRAQRLRLLPGAGALRPAGHPRQVRRAQGALQPDVRQDHRAEGRGRRRGRGARLPRVHAQAGEGRRRREGLLHHDQRQGPAHGHGRRGDGDDVQHRGVGHGRADAEAAGPGQGPRRAGRRGGDGRRGGGVAPPAASLPAGRGQGDAAAAPGAAADGAALPDRGRDRRRVPRPGRLPRVRQRLGDPEGPGGVGGPAGVRPGEVLARRRRRRRAQVGLHRQRAGVHPVRVREEDLRGHRHGGQDDGLLAGDAPAGVRLGAAARRGARHGREVRDRHEESYAARGRADAEAVQS